MGVSDLQPIYIWQEGRRKALCKTESDSANKSGDSFIGGIPCFSDFNLILMFVIRFVMNMYLSPS